MAQVKGSLLPIGGIFAVVGLALAAVGSLVWYFNRDFERTAVRAPGEVIRMQPSGKGSKPVVQFFAQAEGRGVEITSQVSSSPPAYKVGEMVTVMYPPGHPEDARIEGFLEQYFLISIFCGMGALFTVIGLGLIVGYFRSRRAAEA